MEMSIWVYECVCLWRTSDSLSWCFGYTRASYMEDKVSTLVSGRAVHGLKLLAQLSSIFASYSVSQCSLNAGIEEYFSRLILPNITLQVIALPSLKWLYLGPVNKELVNLVDLVECIFLSRC